MKKLIFCMFVLFAACSCKEGVMMDKGMTAIEGGDYTAPIEGCGNQLVPGYTYCRKTEGDIADDALYFIAPPTIQCASDYCTYYEIFFKDGRTITGKIKKGDRVSKVMWKTLLDRDTFEVEDRGFWGFNYIMYYYDQDGKERETFLQGEIRLSVLRKEYTPLHNSPDNPNFVWQWNHNGLPVRMTTGGRVFIGEKYVNSNSNN